MASELIWSAQREPSQLETLRSYVTSVFHEQNHRILWKELPPAPQDPAGLQRYLNFAESLVIACDMALADEIGSIARDFYLTGAIYDPGTPVRRELGRGASGRRTYRNYLHAAQFATWLALELFHPDEIPGATAKLFPHLDKLAIRAAERALKLDPRFIAITNPTWQKRHRAISARKLARGRRTALCLPDSASGQHEQYLISERFFEKLGI